MATRGAERAVFADLADGVRLLVNALTDRRGYGYGFLYWDRVDATGHEHGPDSPQFDAAARLRAGRAGAGARRRTRDAGVSELTVLLCADHGQVAVSPDRVDYLDELWPQLPALLSQPRPAGSSRDAFLHVAPGQQEAVIDGLRERLGDRATEVRPAAELFGRSGRGWGAAGGRGGAAGRRAAGVDALSRGRRALVPRPSRRLRGPGGADLSGRAGGVAPPASPARAVDAEHDQLGSFEIQRRHRERRLVVRACGDPTDHDVQVPAVELGLDLGGRRRSRGPSSPGSAAGRRRRCRLAGGPTRARGEPAPRPSASAARGSARSARGRRGRRSAGP